MRLFSVLFLAFVGGFASHSLLPILEKYFQMENYLRFAAYTIGVLMMQPFAVLIGRSLPEHQDQAERHVTGNLLSALFFGAGVVAGYINDSICER